MKLSILEALFATLCIGLLMLSLRLLPFIVYRKRSVPSFFSFIEKFVPSISIAVLFIACFREKTTDLLINSASPRGEIPGLIAALAASVVTAALHIWKKNAMISIFGGTILYMILNYFL